MAVRRAIPVYHNVRPAPAAPVAIDKEALRERFRKVIIGAGYSDEYATAMIELYYEEYLLDIPQFISMLESYEQAKPMVKYPGHETEQSG